MQHPVEPVLHDAEFPSAMQQAGASHCRVHPLAAAAPRNLMSRVSTINVHLTNIQNILIKVDKIAELTSLVKPRAMSQSIRLVLVRHTAYQSFPKKAKILLVTK